MKWSHSFFFVCSLESNYSFMRTILLLSGHKTIVTISALNFRTVFQVLAKFHKFLFRVYNDLQCKTSLKVFISISFLLLAGNNSKV